MTEKEVLAIIDGLSDEAAYKLLEKAMRHAGKQPEPHWSQKEGHWQRATEAGIVDGTRPRSSMTRAEVVTTMARAGMF